MAVNTLPYFLWEAGGRPGHRGYGCGTRLQCWPWSTALRMSHSDRHQVNITWEEKLIHVFGESFLLHSYGLAYIYFFLLIKERTHGNKKQEKNSLK